MAGPVRTNKLKIPVKSRFDTPQIRSDSWCVLLVDDEERILNFLKTKLKLYGYKVILAANGVEALEQIQCQEPDLVVLDVTMPQKNGFETLKELRTFSIIPVIMLTAVRDTSDRIRGLGLGADDYLAKPFNPDELIARIEAIRRRLSPEKDSRMNKDLILNDLTFNFDKHQVIVRGETVKLTKIEVSLLLELVSNAGHLMTYPDLLSKVWGIEYREDLSILRTWVCRLRKKCRSAPSPYSIITTVPKTGYIFNKLHSEPS